MPEGKTQFSRQEVETFLHSLEQQHRREKVTLEQQLAQMRKQNEYWSQEHEKSLVLIVENAVQKMELEDLNIKMQHAFEQLEKESKTDSLTKLLNRGALIDALQREVMQISRTKDNILKKLQTWKDKKVNEINRDQFFDREENLGILVCAIMDIDHFKIINDTHGHLIGDEVLKEVGRILNDRYLLRNTDITGRFGGEEFLIVLPQTSLSHVRVRLEKICEAIKAKVFQTAEMVTFGITVSVGAADYRDTDTSIELMIKRADEALYYAKEHGRDRVVLSGDFPSSSP